jgi:hypothetical protein
MQNEKKKMPLVNAASKAVKASVPKQSMSSKPSSPKRSATLEKKMTTVSTSRDTTRTAYPEKISPSGTKSQLTKVTYSSSKPKMPSTKNYKAESVPMQKPRLKTPSTKKYTGEGKSEPMQRMMK